MRCGEDSVFPLRAPVLCFRLNIKCSPCPLKNRQGQPETETLNWGVVNVRIIKQKFGIQAEGFKVYTKRQSGTVVCFHELCVQIRLLVLFKYQSSNLRSSFFAGVILKCYVYIKIMLRKVGKAELCLYTFHETNIY